MEYVTHSTESVRFHTAGKINNKARERQGMSVATTVSAFNRTRKWNLFLSNFRPSPTTSVLDVGYTEQEFSPLDNFLEKNYPYPENITALGVGECTSFAARYPKVKTLIYDGISFPFPDKSVDICWSNAVLE